MKEKKKPKTLGKKKEEVMNMQLSSTAKIYFKKENNLFSKQMQNKMR